MKFSIPGKIVLKKEGDKPVSEQLKEMVLERAKEIKLTVPFQATGTFSKNPLQPDGVTPVEVEPVDFGVTLKAKEKEVEITEKKYSKKELEELSFKDLKVIGEKFGTTDRSKKNLIKEILALQ